MITRHQKSEFNRAANQLAQSLSKEIASQAISMKEIGDHIEFNLKVIWSDTDKQFNSSYIAGGQDKF